MKIDTFAVMSAILLIPWTHEGFAELFKCFFLSPASKFHGSSEIEGKHFYTELACLCWIFTKIYLLIDFKINSLNFFLSVYHKIMSRYNSSAIKSRGDTESIWKTNFDCEQKTSSVFNTFKRLNSYVVYRDPTNNKFAISLAMSRRIVTDNSGDPPNLTRL